MRFLRSTYPIPLSPFSSKPQPVLWEDSLWAVFFLHHHIANSLLHAFTKRELVEIEFFRSPNCSSGDIFNWLFNQKSRWGRPSFCYHRRLSIQSASYGIRADPAGDLLIIRDTTYFKCLFHIHIPVPVFHRPCNAIPFDDHVFIGGRHGLKAIRELTILKVGSRCEPKVVSSAILYTVMAPSALFSMVKQPSTFFASKYFFRPSSIFALFTLQELNSRGDKG